MINIDKTNMMFGGAGLGIGLGLGVLGTFIAPKAKKAIGKKMAERTEKKDNKQINKKNENVVEVEVEVEEVKN